MSAEENDKIDKIFDEIAKMNRGLYGDPHNKVPGLMQSHYDLRDDVLKLKEADKKRTWIVAGFSFSVPVIITLAKEWLMGHK